MKTKESLMKLNMFVVCLNCIRIKMEYDFFSAPCLKPTLDNGRVIFFGSLIKFECDSGYTLLFPHPGEEISYCRPNGAWNPPIPTCILEGIYYVLYNEE